MLQGLFKTSIHSNRIQTARISGQQRQDGSAGADNAYGQWTPDQESSSGNEHSDTHDTVVELADPHHGHHHQSEAHNATAPRNEVAAVASPTPNLSLRSASLRMRALYGFLAALDGVLLHFACGMEHDGDSNPSSVTLPSSLPPDSLAKAACGRIFMAGIVSTVIGLLMSSVLAVFMQSENAVVRLLGQRFAGIANRCSITLCSGPNSLAKYFIAWLTVLPTVCGFVLLMLVRFDSI